MTGSAKYGTDYTVNAPSLQVVIPAGQNMATVILHALTDSVRGEKNETAKITFKVKGNPTATVTILNQ